MVKFSILTAGLAIAVVSSGGCGLAATAPSQGQSSGLPVHHHARHPSKAPVVSAAELHNTIFPLRRHRCRK
jgi:hypothetical protein